MLFEQIANGLKIINILFYRVPHLIRSQFEVITEKDILYIRYRDVPGHADIGEAHRRDHT